MSCAASAKGPPFPDQGPRFPWTWEEAARRRRASGLILPVPRICAVTLGKSFRESLGTHDREVKGRLGRRTPCSAACPSVKPTQMSLPLASRRPGALPSRRLPVVDTCAEGLIHTLLCSLPTPSTEPARCEQAAAPEVKTLPASPRLESPSP